jgi:hypothetical protein
MQDFIPDEYPKDINRIPDFITLHNIVTTTRPIYDAHQEKKSYLDASEGMDVIYDGPEWQIIIPRNKGAACELGKGTDWCTAAPGLDYYEQYHKEDDPLFVFKSKKQPEHLDWRYQFHYGSEQFMDTNDHPVDADMFVLLHSLLVNNVSPDMLPKKAKDIIIQGDTAVKKTVKKLSGNGGGEYFENWRIVDPSTTDEHDESTASPHNHEGPAMQKYSTWEGFTGTWYYRGTLVAQMEIPSHDHKLYVTSFKGYRELDWAKEIELNQEEMPARGQFAKPETRTDWINFVKTNKEVQKYFQMFNKAVADREAERKRKKELVASDELQESLQIKIGPLLTESMGREKVFRAMPATTVGIRPGDYLTKSRKFAVEHAVTSAMYNEEPFHVVWAFVKTEDIIDADNPGEYKYAGEKIVNGKASQISDVHGNVKWVKI